MLYCKLRTIIYIKNEAIYKITDSSKLSKSYISSTYIIIVSSIIIVAIVVTSFILSS